MPEPELLDGAEAEAETGQNVSCCNCKLTWWLAAWRWYADGLRHGFVCGFGRSSPRFVQGDPASTNPMDKAHTKCIDRQGVCATIETEAEAETEAGKEAAKETEAATEAETFCKLALKGAELVAFAEWCMKGSNNNRSVELCSLSRPDKHRSQNATGGARHPSADLRTAAMVSCCQYATLGTAGNRAYTTYSVSGYKYVEIVQS